VSAAFDGSSERAWFVLLVLLTMAVMRRTIGVLIGVTVVSFAPVAALAAAGSPATGTPDPRVSALEAKVGEATKAESEALARLSSTQGTRRRLDATIRSLDARIGDATRRLAVAEADAQRLGGAYAEQANRVTTMEARLGSSRAAFGRAVRALYQRGGDVSPRFARVFPDTKALGRALQSRAYLAALSDAQHRDVVRFARLRDDAVHARDLLDGQRQQAAAARATAAQQAKELTQLRAQQDRARQDAVAAEADETQIVRDLQSSKDDYVRQLNELTAVSDTIQNEMARRQAGQKPGSLRFSRPVGGAIVSGFGYRIHPIFHTRRLHSGVDFEEVTGVPIKAAGGGVVAIAGARGGYGNAVVIDHGNQLATLYGHQSRIAVTVGQRVVAGQVIGYVGSTGWATGPHLHFEVRVLGVPVDPTKYL